MYRLTLSTEAKVVSEGFLHYRRLPEGKFTMDLRLTNKLEIQFKLEETGPPNVDIDPKVRYLVYHNCFTLRLNSNIFIMFPV